MNILLLKGFNNYFNRIVKKYSSLADYKTNSASYLDLANINFNPNDGVATELIIGSQTQQEPASGDTTRPLTWDLNGTPDYAICYEMEGTPAAAVIKFRWFVLEAERTRNGQYRIALKRDVIAEHLTEIMSAPCFVEKGIINDPTDPLLFNKEGMSFNQIKQEELLLKDKTKCGWIVGYVSQDKTRYPASGYYESTSPVATYEDYDDLPSELKRLANVGSFEHPVNLSGGWGTPAGRVRLDIWYKCLAAGYYQNITFTNVYGASELTFTTPTTTQPSGVGYLYGAWGSEYELVSGSMTGPGGRATIEKIRYNSTLRDYYVNNILTNGEDFDNATQQMLYDWNGRYFKRNGKLYQIKFETSGRHYGPKFSVLAGTTYATALDNCFLAHRTENDGWFFQNSGGTNGLGSTRVRISSPASGNKICDLMWECYTGTVSFIEVTADVGDKIKAYIPANRLQACDTPMDLFAIPYSDDFIIYRDIDAETGDPDPSTAIKMSKQVSLQAAVTLAQAGSNVYDIQILPYFPNPNMIESEESGGIGEEQVVLPNTPFTSDIHYNYFYNTSDAPIGIIFWSRTSVFTTDIESELTLPNQTAKTLKESNECDLYRLTSPNYAGSFEFSLAKSGGRIEKFNADCTYKPYSPYIHVTPDLAGLYGDNFSAIDDARGLLCGGDYSITKIVDQWQQYELQNKNYQNIFDRQIQNLDVNQQIEREQFQFNTTQNLANMAAAPLSVAGIASFVKTGITNPLFTSLGAVNEGDWLRRSQAESKDYTIDMYNYQLGNIKALPIALSRTTAQTNNNKIFPFVEYFTCTSAEKDALDAKIRYNGMTIMKISTLDNYAHSADYDKVYVKGQLVRLENVNDDFHIIDAIYQEVNKGFFMPQ